MSGKTTLERAVELARTGEYAGTDKIRLQLTAEGYMGVQTQIAGKTLVRQLNRLSQEARAAAAKT